MADTGAPWNIPFAEPTDLVRDWPALSEDVADAVAAGLDAAGGLVAVKSAIFTGTQTASVTAGNNVAVTDLTITHEVADAANKLIITAIFGSSANSLTTTHVGIAVHDGTGLIGVGDADGSRVRVGGGGSVSPTGSGTVVGQFVSFVHTPGAGSKTYTVRVLNIDTSTRTLFVNRGSVDSNSAQHSRAVSSLVIQEVKV